LFLLQLEADVEGTGERGGGGIAQGHCDEDLGFWDVILCCSFPDISEEHGAFGVLKGRVVQGDYTWVA
jgi:hypothetical protein